MRVLETPKGRFYVTPSNNKYVSITTMLGVKEKPWLEQWRESLGQAKADTETKRCAARGNAVHTMANKFLSNDVEPTKGQLLEHVGEFNSLKLVLKKIDNIYALEIPLYSDVLKVAGRVDCIAEWDGQLAVIDFKTSTNDKSSKMIEDYYLQAAGYALMFHEMYDIQINEVVIVITVEKGIVPLVFKRDVESYIEPLIQRINTYYTQAGVSK